MKNLFFLFFTIAIFSVILVSSCQKDFNITLDDAENNDGIIMHENTQIIRISDKKSKLILPKDVFFVITDKDDDLSIPEGTGGISVTCECTDGSGCDPTLLKGKYLCVMRSTCDVCKKSTAASDKDVIVKGMVDYNKGITFLSERMTGDVMQDAFLSTKEEIHGQAFKELFQLEGVKNKIIEMYQHFYLNQIPDFIFDNNLDVPENYTYVYANIFGNMAAIPLPTNIVNEQKKFSPIIVQRSNDGNTIRCSCLSGTEGCIKKSSWGVVYCDSGVCTKCQLKSSDGLDD